MRVLRENEKVILSNPNNGAWIRMSEEVYLLIKKYVNRGKDSVSDYIIEDREYIEELIKRLLRIGIVNYEDDSKLTRVDFAITSFCNLKCKHCSNSLMEKVKEPKFQDIINAFYKLSEIKIDELCITGGEPMLRREFKEIVNTASGLFENLTLMTNGTLISKDNVDFLCKKFNAISISIDGFNTHSCEMIRGKGVFEKVIEAVKLLHENNYYNISLSSVINTYSRLDEFYKLCNALKVKPIVRKYAPTGRGQENEEELFLSIFKNESIKKRNFVDYLRKNRINYGFTENATTVCSAYKESIYIGSDLKIYPCGALNLPEFQGNNICDISDIKSYINEKEYKKTRGFKNYNKIMPENADYCNGCSVYIFCNDCPAYLYLYHKNGYLTSYCKNCKEYMREKIYENY